MSADLTALTSDPSTTLLGGALAILVAKDVLGVAVKAVVGRFFRRSERLETKREEEHEDWIRQLLDQVTGVRHALEIMGERLTNHQVSASETKARVNEHDGRISALEVGHAALATRVEILDRGGKDD